MQDLINMGNGSTKSLLKNVTFWGVIWLQRLQVIFAVQHRQLCINAQRHLPVCHIVQSKGFKMNALWDIMPESVKKLPTFMVKNKCPSIRTILPQRARINFIGLRRASPGVRYSWLILWQMPNQSNHIARWSTCQCFFWFYVCLRMSMIPANH